MHNRIQWRGTPLHGMSVHHRAHACRHKHKLLAFWKYRMDYRTKQGFPEETPVDAKRTCKNSK